MEVMMLFFQTIFVQIIIPGNLLTYSFANILISFTSIVCVS